MSSLHYRVAQVKQQPGYWAERAASELDFALRVSAAREGMYDALVCAALDGLENSVLHSGSIDKTLCLRLEEALSPMAKACKEHHVICCGHAHIDMNWQWGFDETVAVTLETFRTVLSLMDEFPEFTFSQSQASTYRIAEEYDPALLERIRARVREGRWEVAATTWVEADRNMPSGESMARHHLYTRRYLKTLLGLKDEDFTIDYEPDTFGHSLNVPESLAQAGVKYYYHCRGNDKTSEPLYRWQAPSGRSILVYLEPEWYLGPATSGITYNVVEFCKQYDVDTALYVYGVGDHGGGPTRRDLRAIEDMRAWPIYPSIRFGRYDEFYPIVEKSSKIPVKTGEWNFVFTGCYTSQARLKMANRKGEGMLMEAEGFAAQARVEAGHPYEAERFETAWRNVLFGQFHDILPGSGVIGTREWGMGQFQQTSAITSTLQIQALRAVASRADTSRFLRAEDASSTSEGAGVGYGMGHRGLPLTDRGNGTQRLYHVFNPLPFPRREVMEITVFDWRGDLRRLAAEDERGEALPLQVVSSGKDAYWGHDFIKVAIEVEAPATGRTLIRLFENTEGATPVAQRADPRAHPEVRYVLENDCLRAELDPHTASLRSLTDKRTGRALVDESRPGGLFRLIREDPSRGMTSWVVGQYMSVEDCPGQTHIRPGVCGPLCQSVTLSRRMERATLECEISLGKGSAFLQYRTRVKWDYTGTAEEMPLFAFQCPAAYACDEYEYDIPLGSVRRPALDMDVPAISWARAMGGGESHLMLATDSKYGFRGFGDALQVSLIRSSTEPDPMPENCEHDFTLWLGASSGCAGSAAQAAAALNHPLLYVSDRPHAGDLPATAEGLRVSGAALSGMKWAEDGSGLIVRVYDVCDGCEAVIQPPKGAKHAQLCDTHESALKALAFDGKVALPLGPLECATVKFSY